MSNLNITSGGGTGPLRPRIPTGAPTTPLSQPPAAAPGRSTGDLNRVSGRTGQLPAPTGPAAELLARQEELSAMRAQLAQQQMEQRARAEEPSVWGRMSAWASGVVDRTKQDARELRQKIRTLEAEIEEIAQDGAQAISDGVTATAQSLRAGKSLDESLGAGVDAASATAAREIISPMLDRSALGKGDQAADRHDVLGPILTNRLAMGESASIRLEAGATLPLEALGIPNARLDGAGTLEIRRVPKTGPDGQPLTEPRDSQGMPPSELKVTVTVEGQAGAFYSAEVGMQAGLDVGNYTVGPQASARAEAEAGVKGRVAVTFAFDPQNAADMNALGGMIKATAESGATDSFPGLASFMGSAEASSSANRFREFGRRIESVEGEGGLYAQANASLSVDAGPFERLETNEAGRTERTYTDRGSELTSFDQLAQNIGALEAAVGGQASVGGRVNLRTGERTVFVGLQGAAQGAASLASFGQEIGAAADRKLALTYNREGQLTNVRINTEVSREQFEGLRSTVEDIYGRPLQQGLIAGIGEEDKVRISYELRPEHRERIASLLQGSMAERTSAVRELAGLTIAPDTVRLNQGDVVAVHVDNFSIGGSFAVSMGAVAGVRGRLTLGRAQESVVD